MIHCSSSCAYRVVHFDIPSELSIVSSFLSSDFPSSNICYWESKVKVKNVIFWNWDYIWLILVWNRTLEFDQKESQSSFQKVKIIFRFVDSVNWKLIAWVLMISLNSFLIALKSMIVRLILNVFGSQKRIGNGWSRCWWVKFEIESTYIFSPWTRFGNDRRFEGLWVSNWSSMWWARSHWDSKSSILLGIDFDLELMSRILICTLGPKMLLKFPSEVYKSRVYKSQRWFGFTR